MTEEEMRLAMRKRTDAGGCPTGTTAGADNICRTAKGQPVLNYEAVYPNTAPWTTEGKADLPIFNMIQGNRIVHTEVDAVIAYAGPGQSAFTGNGHFPPSTYPLESLGKRNPAYANRLEAFRDFAQVWHDEAGNAQAYPGFYNLAGFIPPNPACAGAPRSRPLPRWTSPSRSSMLSCWRMQCCGL